jgi:hypothetical protein
MDRRDETVRKVNLFPNLAVPSNVSGWFIFSAISARLAGRDSVPPERLLKAWLLMASYTV